MKRLRFAAWPVLLALAFGSQMTLAAGPEIGEPAPDFSVIGSDGKVHTLSDYRGRKVILEWTNHDCPYVRKHYDSGNMQALQKDAGAEGYVWLSIISSAPGKQGHVSAAGANALTKERGAEPLTVLLDEDGKVGRLYGARTTPQMFVIDESGTLRFAGGIDDKPTSNKKDIESATNFVRAAMAQIAAGEPVSVTRARPYGCSVKYET